MSAQKGASKPAKGGGGGKGKKAAGGKGNNREEEETEDILQAVVCAIREGDAEEVLTALRRY